MQKNKKKLSEQKRGSAIHCIGIGGIGVSALAKYFLSQGHRISGSDVSSSEITEELQKLGTVISIGTHDKENISADVTQVIYTAAVAENNPELVEARQRGITAKTYAEALGELTKQFDTITVSGSHGKSTTTSLIALALEEGYFDPTVIVGTKVKEFGNSNFRRGYGSHLVLEADEWNKSFLHYSPKYAVITNIDAEHLDTYGTVEEVEKAFQTYLEKIPDDGIIVANADDERVRRVATPFGVRVAWYSLGQPEARTLQRILKIHGAHNLSNALAALILARALGVHEPAIIQALSRFSGTWRRFEFKGIVNGAHVFDDYGHHPKEIMATIKAARSRFPMRRVWCIYQPHQHQRLEYLWNDFVEAFDMADRVCLLPVYEVMGREKTENKKIHPALSAASQFFPRSLIGHRKGGINSKTLTHELLLRGKNAHHVNSFFAAKKLIEASARMGDVILIMGAGDIYLLTKKLVQG